MRKVRAVRFVKVGLALASCYFVWWCVVQLCNFTGHIPEYRTVSLTNNPILFEKVQKVEGARAAQDGLIEERVQNVNDEILRGADGQALKWLILKRFPVWPRQITRFTVCRTNEVEISVR